MWASKCSLKFYKNAKFYFRFWSHKSFNIYSPIQLNHIQVSLLDMNYNGIININTYNHLVSIIECHKHQSYSLSWLRIFASSLAFKCNKMWLFTSSDCYRVQHVKCINIKPLMMIQNRERRNSINLRHSICNENLGRVYRMKFTFIKRCY